MITIEDILKRKFIYQIKNNKKYTFQLKIFIDRSNNNYYNNNNNLNNNNLNNNKIIYNNIKLCTICNPIGDYQSIKEKELYIYVKQFKIV